MVAGTGAQDTGASPDILNLVQVPENKQSGRDGQSREPKNP
jgi:hypothetical protein